jgi:hypothetical protein
VPARRGGHPQCRSSMQRKPQTTDSRIPTLPVSGTAAAVAGAGRETPASVGVSSSACTCRRRFRVGREGGAGSGSARQPSLARDAALSTVSAPTRAREAPYTKPTSLLLVVQAIPRHYSRSPTASPARTSSSRDSRIPERFATDWDPKGTRKPAAVGYSFGGSDGSFSGDMIGTFKRTIGESLNGGPPVGRERSRR